ncbi:MAG: hypothetical protein ACW987_20570 [Candidatus Thorarchaeota archaeon]
MKFIGFFELLDADKAIEKFEKIRKMKKEDYEKVRTMKKWDLSQ